MTKHEVREMLLQILKELSLREHKLIDQEMSGFGSCGSNAMWKAIATVVNYASDYGIIIDEEEYNTYPEED